MGINNKQVSLKQRMVELSKDNTAKVAVILVDETTTDSDISNDRDNCHSYQSLILKYAGFYKFGIFIVKYGFNGSFGETEGFNGGLGTILDNAIGNGVTAYHKGLTETNGFENTRLVDDMSAYTHAIIMGQSTNACCAATARGAKELGLEVLTCKKVMRGGGVATSSLQYFGAASSFAGWPDGTDLHASV